MNRSLSVLLPVVNCEATLRQLAAEILEILPELSTRFELRIIDHGSTDGSREAAQELALRYPQVSSDREPAKTTLIETLRRGLLRAGGEMVLLYEPDCQVHIAELPKLWRAGEKYDLSIGIAANSARLAQPPMLAQSSRLPTLPGVQLVRRTRARTWLLTDTDETLHSFLIRKGGSVHEMPLRSRGQQAGLAHRSPATRLTAAEQGGRLDSAGAAPQPAAMRRQKYLSRLRAFARGE